MHPHYMICFKGLYIIEYKLVNYVKSHAQLTPYVLKCLVVTTAERQGPSTPKTQSKVKI